MKNNQVKGIGSYSDAFYNNSHEILMFHQVGKNHYFSNPINNVSFVPGRISLFFRKCN